MDAKQLHELQEACDAVVDAFARNPTPEAAPLAAAVATWARVTTRCISELVRDREALLARVKASVVAVLDDAFRIRS